MASKSTAKGPKTKSNEEIAAGFQLLRQEQRQLANKISELEMDLNEHKIVIDTLKQVDGSRKCFRMVGGVLVERTAGEILPQLEATRDQLPLALTALQEQLTAKGTAINKYVVDNNIRLNRDYPEADEPPPTPEADIAPVKTNVLVANS